jgi:Mu transposase, C-terminal domain
MNRYLVPPHLLHQMVTGRANGQKVRIVHQGWVISEYVYCYQRQQLIVLPDHPLPALIMTRYSWSNVLERAFDVLGPAACWFHLGLKCQPVKSSIHLHRFLGLA